jgi:hypothetical protein
MLFLELLLWDSFGGKFFSTFIEHIFYLHLYDKTLKEKRKIIRSVRNSKGKLETIFKIYLFLANSSFFFVKWYVGAFEVDVDEHSGLTWMKKGPLNRDFCIVWNKCV